jgi:DNA repair exonuclease SbcCD ATPase subunit
MKKVIFKTISIRNFLSFGDDPVVLNFSSGVHIVTGMNRDKEGRQNGIGKSSMMESLYFAIFGTTMREIKKDLIQNRYTKKECVVELDFDVITASSHDVYRIVRKNPNSSLSFSKNGIDITRDSIKNTEEDIHTLLNATPNVFQNCVVMTMNETIPFMAKGKVDKKKFIEGIFNLIFFSEMLNHARSDFNNTKRIIENERAKYEESVRNLDSLNNRRNAILDARKSKIETYLERKKNNELELKSLVSKSDEIESFDLEKINLDLAKCEKALNSIDLKLRNSLSEKTILNTTISSYNISIKKMSIKDSSCPTCFRKIEDHDKYILDIEISKLKSEIEKCNTELNAITENIAKYEDQKKRGVAKVKQLNADLSKAKVQESKKEDSIYRIDQLKKWLVSLDSDIAELQSGKTDIDELIPEQKLIIEKNQSSLDDLHFNLRIYDLAKHIFSEEGVKTVIVNRLLETFNERLEYYLQRMDANCTCYFNETFDEIIKNDKDEICSYFNFSGAERKAIDFACLFAFMDMRRIVGNVVYNVSIYDELFDSSLDEKAINLISDILKERVNLYDECVYIISHRKESIGFATGNVYFLEKKDGVTRMLDYNPF